MYSKYSNGTTRTKNWTEAHYWSTINYKHVLCLQRGHALAANANTPRKTQTKDRSGISLQNTKKGIWYTVNLRHLPLAFNGTSNRWSPAGGSNNTDSITWNTNQNQHTAVYFIIKQFISQSASVPLSILLRTLQSYMMNTFLHKYFSVD